MKRITAATVLGFSLAMSQISTSWANLPSTPSDVANRCGPVFAEASETYKENFGARLIYTSRKELVLKEYLWTQRKALTYKATAEVAAGSRFSPTKGAGVGVQDCYTTFSHLESDPSWKPIIAKVDLNQVDQQLEDMIAAKLPLGYQRLMSESKKLRSQIPFRLNDSLIAQRLVFDPPSMIVYANDPVAQRPGAYRADTLLCEALKSHKVDRALYPLIRLRVLAEDNSIRATASGSQCP